jgi:hypothetical protein
VPYDIEAFDQVEGQTVTQVDDEVAARCGGNPDGGPTCLIVIFDPPVPSGVSRDACTVGPPAYDPAPKNVPSVDPETGETVEKRMLRRPTAVTLTTSCSDAPPGATPP